MRKNQAAEGQIIGARLFFCIATGIACFLATAGWSYADSPRPAQQIISDLNNSAVPNYSFGDQIDPRYREQMARELTPPLQKNVALWLELQKASPQYAEEAREKVCLHRAELALLGDQSARQALTAQARSSVVPDALAGKLGLQLMNWWDNASDADKQQAMVPQFETLAKSNASDDLVCGALLQAARYGAANDQVGDALRDIVEKDLTSPAAISYKASPSKIGRPFVLSGDSVDRKLVSTATWKGKVIVIDFWATWCGPCRQSMPELIKLYQDDHDKGLEVLGVSNDSDFNELRNFLNGNKEMVWPQLFGPGGPNGWNRISQQMDVNAIPTEFYVDRNGILRDIEVNNLRSDLVAKLLAEPVSAPSAAPAAEKPAVADATPPVAANSTPPPTDSGSGQESGSKESPAAAAAASNQDAAGSPEDRANAMLSQAKLLVDNGRTDLAISKLNTLIQNYPKTDAAQRAQQLLSTLNGNQ